MSCACKIKMLGLGADRCNFQFNIIRGVIFFDMSEPHTYLTDGVIDIQNSISLGIAVSTPKLYDVSSTKEDSVFQTFTDGTAYLIREGVRTISGIIPKPTFYQLKAMTRLRCKKLGVYLVDNNGNLLGVVNGNNLDPIPIVNETIDSVYSFATDSTIQQLSFRFQISSLVREYDYRVAEFSPTNYINSIIENPPINPISIPGATNVYSLSGQTLQIYIGYDINKHGTYGDFKISDFTSPMFAIAIKHIQSNATISIGVPASNIISPSNPTTIINLDLSVIFPTITVGHTIQILAIKFNPPFYSWLDQPITITVS